MLARERQQLYAFFSRLFVRELDPAFLEVLVGPLGRSLLPELFEGEAGIAGFGGEGQAAIYDADFVHLTVVDGVPYASFYQRQDGMIEAGAANPLVGFLEQYGFEVDLGAARALSPDHLGVELEVMAVLCGKEAEAEPSEAPQIRAVQRAFLAEQLLGWAPVYLNLVQRLAYTRLYAVGAAAALEFLLSDHEALLQEAE